MSFTGLPLWPEVLRHGEEDGVAECTAGEEQVWDVRARDFDRPPKEDVGNDSDWGIDARDKLLECRSERDGSGCQRLGAGRGRPRRSAAARLRRTKLGCVRGRVVEEDVVVGGLNVVEEMVGARGEHGSGASSPWRQFDKALADRRIKSVETGQDAVGARRHRGDSGGEEREANMAVPSKTFPNISI